MSIRAVEHIGKVGMGYTNPQLLKCEDGLTYVVKFLHPYIRKKSLPNEYLAYELGQFMDLPMPNCSVIYVPEELIQASPLKDLNVNPGLHFGSHFQVKTKKVNKKHLSQCSNIEKIADMFVFDIWVDNRDRKKNNLLIVKEKGKLKLLCIDHDYIFGDKNWGLETLLKYDGKVVPKWGKTHDMLIKYVPDPSLFTSSLQSIQALDTLQIKKVVDDIPEEWDVTKEERKALVFLLEKRKNILKSNLINIIKQHY